MTDLIITPPFVVSFPHIFTPSSYMDSEPKYSVTAIWREADLKAKYKTEWKAVLSLLDVAAREKFQQPLARLPANVRKGIRNGIEKEHLNGYGKGMLFAPISSTRRPQVVDLKHEPMLADDDRIYPGCWMRASVTAYAYANVGKGVALGLANLQWLGHGTRLDSRTTASQDFGDSRPDDEWFAAADSPGDEPVEAAGPELDDDEIPF